MSEIFRHIKETDFARCNSTIQSQTRPELTSSIQPIAIMKLILPTLAFTLAVSTTAQYVNKSSPFNLYLESADPAVNGSTLSACHVGAAIESLCVSNSNSTSKPNPIAPSIFSFNSSAYINPEPTLGSPGLLTYALPTTPTPINSVLTFYIDPTTNYALPLLEPGSGGAQVLAFDQANFLGIQGYVDYKVSPPKAGERKQYNDWWVCATYFEGYQYVNLVWGLGGSTPETPGCVEADVRRSFI
jgi:hypothetical protein